MFSQQNNFNLQAILKREKVQIQIPMLFLHQLIKSAAKGISTEKQLTNIILKYEIKTLNMPAVKYIFHRKNSAYSFTFKVF